MTGFLYGSPKAKNSASQRLIQHLQQDLGTEDHVIISALSPDYELLDRCDRIVVVFPLYVDGLPSHLLQVLMKYESCTAGGTKIIYALCHCGFYEGEQNKLAIRMIEHFCTHTGFTFGGGLGLGAGLMLDSGVLPTAAAKPLQEAISQLAAAIRKGSLLEEPVCVHLSFPRFLYIIGGNMMWKQEGKRNHLSAKALRIAEGHPRR